MKHMSLKYASLQDDIRDKEIVLKYRKSEENVADFLTKGVKNETFSRDRELAGVVKYKEQTSSSCKVSVTGRKLVAMIMISQFGKVGAVALDVEFLGFCWLLGLGVSVMMLTIARVLLKCVWTTPCRRMISSTVTLWDYLMDMVKITTHTDGRRIYLCKHGERFHVNRSCTYVTDKSNRMELKSGVKHIRMCENCQRLGWDAEDFDI